MYYCNNERLSKRKGAARDEWRYFFLDCQLLTDMIKL
jgi:hypothetical protein